MANDKTKPQHYIDLGYHDPTVVYEIQLVKIAEIPAGTPLIDIVFKLDRLGIKNVVADARPEQIDWLRQLNITAQRAILHTPKEGLL